MLSERGRELFRSHLWTLTWVMHSQSDVCGGVTEANYKFAPKASRRPSQSFTTNSRECHGVLASPRLNSTPPRGRRQYIPVLKGVAWSRFNREATPMSVTQNEKAVRFRALHDGPGVFVIPNPWDVGSARILTGLGFQALATSSAASASALGRRDGGLTREEAMAHTRSIVGATDLPVSADLEKGFGDAPEVVAETIRLAAGTGLVGCTIEDTLATQNAPFTTLVWLSKGLLRPRRRHMHFRLPSS
jgi:phosphoenolpyruvate phosphomutase-like protein